VYIRDITTDVKCPVCRDMFSHKYMDYPDPDATEKVCYKCNIKIAKGQEYLMSGSEVWDDRD